MDMNGDGLNDLLSYCSATGQAIYELAIPGAPGMRNLVSTVSAAKGWTSIVPMNIHGERPALDGLSKARRSPTPSLIRTLRRAGGAWPSTPSAGITATPTVRMWLRMRDAAPGWDGDRPDAIEQRFAHRLAVLQRRDRSGHLFDGDGTSQTIVRTVNAAPGWTSSCPST